MNDHFAMLARFNGWVNKILYDHVEKLSEQVYRADSGLFFKSVHNTLNHLLLVDLAWMARIRGDTTAGIHSLDQVLYDDFEILRRQRLQTDNTLTDLIDGLRQSDLSAPVNFTCLDGSTEELGIDIILLTLFNHQTHHRGQINAVLTRNGIIPPDVDILDFLQARANA